MAHFSTHDLPLELVSALNDTYVLHVLATDPAKLVPPGKSLVSMLLGSSLLPESAPDAHKSMKDKVEASMHRVFWDEAVLSLSSPEPASQLERIKGLRTDLLEVIQPLFPQNHQVIVSLSGPLAPTSSPILYTLNSFKEVVLALRQRCAPTRDASLDELLHHIDHPSPHPDPTDGPHTSQSAEHLVQMLRDIIKVAEAMKSDLNNFVLSRMQEKDITNLITERARSREKSLVIQAWNHAVDSAHGDPESITLNLWASWIASLKLPWMGLNTSDIRAPWIVRLMQALAAPLAVTCELPNTDNSSESNNTDRNELPPQFLFTRTALVIQQNFLQALVIAATLRSLTRLPPGAKLESGESGIDFMSRVWTLLRLEIEDEDPTGREGTKIANLIDEVVRARKLAIEMETPGSGSDLIPGEEDKLRTAVQRALRVDDPIFLLLQKRLLSALTPAILSWCYPDSPEGHSRETAVPFVMRTGRAMQTSAGPKNPSATFTKIDAPLVQGFEEPVLQEGIRQCLQSLVLTIEWVQHCWDL